MQRSTGLRDVQEESVRRLHAWMIQTGWREDQLAICEGPSIVCVEDEEPFFAFHQEVIDQRVQKRFAIYRERLAANYRVQQLPLDRVGALASINLDAFVGFADSPTEDFIAISYGTLKLRLWGIVTANAHGAEIFTRSLTQGPAEGQVLTQQWWQSSILATAGDILGYMWDYQRVAEIVVWDFKAGDLGGWDDALWFLLEAFIIYHEIAHYELGHGDHVRTLAAAGRSPSVKENYAMEWEADQFAWEKMRELARDEDAALTTLATLFALLAIRPDLLQQYPLCPDGPSHPHPLTRFIWLIRKISGGHPVDLYEHVWFALSFVRYALETFGDRHPSITEARLSGFMDRKGDAPSG